MTPADRYRCCGIQAKSSLLPSPGLSEDQSEPHSLQQLSRDPAFPVGPGYPPTSCQNPAQLPLAEVTKVPSHPGDCHCQQNAVGPWGFLFK